MSKTENNRAGSYIIQPGGYRAFIPRPLPPYPPITFDSELLRLLSDADRALGRLDGVTQTLPNPDMFTLMYVRQEALYSSQIEGTQASLDQILVFEDQLSNADNPDDIEEVVNYVAAFKFGMKRLNELPLSLRLIRELHALLMQGVRGRNKQPGELRSVQNWIGPPGSDVHSATFIPPPCHEMLDALRELEAYWHTSNEQVLIQIGLAHAQFETIHPFLDGNGRLGRLLITFLLYNKNVLVQPTLYLSHYFKRYKSEYYQRLQEIRDDGAWEPWLKFFLRGVKEVANGASAKGQRIKELRDYHLNLISRELRSAQAGHAAILVDSMQMLPVISVSRAAEIIGKTYQTANTLIAQLERLGLLEEITGGERNRRYRYTPYIALFSEDT